MAKINLEVIQCDECQAIQPATTAVYYTVHGYVTCTAPHYESGRLKSSRSASLLGAGPALETILCSSCFKKKALAAEDY